MITNYIGRENESADQFAFDIEIEKKATLHFAICYNINSTEYWDNNNGNNCRVTFLNLMLYLILMKCNLLFSGCVDS